MISMKRARKLHHAACFVPILGPKGERWGCVRVGSPFRTWARKQWAPHTTVKLSPKLARIVRGVA